MGLIIEIIIFWIIIVLFIVPFKVRQSNKFGFKTEISIKTLLYAIFGIFFWPLILFSIIQERKIYRESYLRSKEIRTGFDFDEMNELERIMGKLDKGAVELDKKQDLETK